MGAIAVFDYGAWIARYPEFASVSQAAAQAYFNEACLYLANDGTGPICNATTQLLILNMITAHLAKLYATITLANGQTQAPSGLVGRVSSANEGSVSVSTDMGEMPGSAAWFAQSPYGLSAWQALAPTRTMRYIARPRWGVGIYPAVGGYPW